MIDFARLDPCSNVCHIIQEGIPAMQLDGSDVSECLLSLCIFADLLVLTDIYCRSSPTACSGLSLADTMPSFQERFARSEGGRQLGSQKREDEWYCCQDAFHSCPQLELEI